MLATDCTPFKGTSSQKPATALVEDERWSEPDLPHFKLEVERPLSQHRSLTADPASRLESRDRPRPLARTSPQYDSMSSEGILPATEPCTLSAVGTLEQCFSKTRDYPSLHAYPFAQREPHPSEGSLSTADMCTPPAERSPEEHELLSTYENVERSQPLDASRQAELAPSLLDGDLMSSMTFSPHESHLELVLHARTSIERMEDVERCVGRDEVAPTEEEQQSSQAVSESRQLDVPSCSSGFTARNMRSDGGLGFDRMYASALLWEIVMLTHVDLASTKLLGSSRSTIVETILRFPPCISK